MVGLHVSHAANTNLVLPVSMHACRSVTLLLKQYSYNNTL